MPGFSDKLEVKGQKLRCKKIIYCKDLAQIFIMTNWMHFGGEKWSFKYSNPSLYGGSPSVKSLSVLSFD